MQFSDEVGAPPFFPRLAGRQAVTDLLCKASRSSRKGRSFASVKNFNSLCLVSSLLPPPPTSCSLPLTTRELLFCHRLPSLSQLWVTSAVCSRCSGTCDARTTDEKPRMLQVDTMATPALPSAGLLPCQVVLYVLTWPLLLHHSLPGPLCCSTF